jgi:hypothetical protein
VHIYRIIFSDVIPRKGSNLLTEKNGKYQCNERCHYHCLKLAISFWKMEEYQTEFVTVSSSRSSQYLEVPEKYHIGDIAKLRPAGFRSESKITQR